MQSQPIVIDPQVLQFITEAATFIGVAFAAYRAHLNGRGNAVIKQGLQEVHVLVNGNNEALRAELVETRNELKAMNENLLTMMNKDRDKTVERRAVPQNSSDALTADTVANAINSVNKANVTNASSAAKNVADAGQNIIDHDRNVSEARNKARR